MYKISTSTSAWSELNNADMFRHFKTVATFAVVFLVTVSKTHADIVEFMANFQKGKTVATSYQTLERFSKVQCAEKCYKEGKKGRCRIAGYNKDTKICRLSMDSQQVLDIADDSSGVFIYQQEPIVTTQGILYGNATPHVQFSCYRLRFVLNIIYIIRMVTFGKDI